MQKCGQILCAHKPYFLMPGHICRHDTAVSQKSDEMIIPMQQGVPSIESVLKSCNFNNCVVNFSSRPTDESHCNYASSYQAAELLEGINIDEVLMNSTSNRLVPIMLLKLPIMLWSNAPEFYPLCSINQHYAQ